MVVRDLKDLLEENDEAAEAKIIEFNELKALVRNKEIFYRDVILSMNRMLQEKS